jgi:hypothetical protein
MRTQILSLGLIVSIASILAGCGTSIALYYKVNDKVNTALTDENSPPERAVTTNVIIDLGNWRLEALSASPNNDFLALGMFNDSGSQDEGKLEIYNRFGQSLNRIFTNQNLIDMIESSTTATYPSSGVAMNPFALGYQDDSILIVHIQPIFSNDSTLLDVEMKIDLKTELVFGTPIFFKRTQRPSFPVHPSKTQYDFTVMNGEMFVDGDKIDGLPNNIDPDPSLHDEVAVN